MDTIKKGKIQGRERTRRRHLMERGKSEGHKRQKEKTLSNLENTDIRRREGTEEQVQEKNS